MNPRRAAVPLLLLALLARHPDAAAGGGKAAAPRARSPVVPAGRATSRAAIRRTSPRTRRPPADTPEGRLRDELEGIWGGRVLRRGVTAVYVVDARTGEDIYAVHPDDKVNPASNVKLLSTATVLDLMGPEWRYLTRLFGPAPDPAGVAHGDVYLRGNADPTLNRSSLDALARAVARSGVKRIEGDVLLSDDVMREAIAPPPIRIRVQAGSRPGAPALVSVDPADSYVQVHVTATTTLSRNARLTITAEPITTPAPDADVAHPPDGWDGPRVMVRVGGTIRRGRSGTYLRSPGMRSTFTGFALRRALRAAGVDVTGGVRLSDFDGYTRAALAAGFLPIELGRYRSRSMRELVTMVNKRSLNGLADRLLMTAGSEAAGGGPPSMERGLEAMYRWLERSGLSRKELVVDTGSGLSHRTKLTARHLVRVLRSAAGYTSQLTRQSLLDPGSFLASLAVGGVDGTLRGRFRSDNLRGRVVAKTGTLSNSIALSGFLSDERGPALCFAIVTNGNQWGARYRVRREHELMVAAMKRYLDARAPHDTSPDAATTTHVAAQPVVPAAPADLDDGVAPEEAGEGDEAGSDEAGEEGSGDERGGDSAARPAPARPAPARPADSTAQAGPARPAPARPGAGDATPDQPGTARARSPGAGDAAAPSAGGRLGQPKRLPESGGARAPDSSPPAP